MVLLCVSWILLAWTQTDHDPSSGLGAASGSRTNPTDSAREESCPVSADELVSLANGLGGSLDRIPGYLTTPACTDNSFHLGSTMIGNVRFRDSGPYGFLKEQAVTLEKSRFELMGPVEERLLKRLGDAVRDNPLTVGDVAIVSQMAILSPRVGRQALGNVIGTELSREPSAGLAGRLVRLGTGLEPVSSLLAESVSEMAILAQANSIKHILSNLALSSSTEPSLASTFNRVASAVNLGVSKGIRIYDKKQRRELSGAIFWGVYDSVLGAPGLEPGSVSLNEALELLTQGLNLRLPGSKEPMEILAKTETQSAIARVVASSMAKSATITDTAVTPALAWGGGTTSPNTTLEVMQWKGEARDRLLAAAAGYQAIALELQRQFLNSWDVAWRKALSGDVVSFNRVKKGVLTPYAEAIVGLPPELIAPEFVEVVIRGALVSDAVIEARLPKLVLDRYASQNASAALFDRERSPQAIVRALSQNFSDALALQRTYIPALNGWIERQTKD